MNEVNESQDELVLRTRLGLTVLVVSYLGRPGGCYAQLAWALWGQVNYGTLHLEG